MYFSKLYKIFSSIKYFDRVKLKPFSLIFIKTNKMFGDYLFILLNSFI